MFSIKEIIIDENSELFNKNNMHYYEFNSNIKKIKFYTSQIIQNPFLNGIESELLKQQIEELISNAIIHGNKNDINKKIKIWFSCDSKKARIIVEDEGQGFKDIEKWNSFNKKRIKYLSEKNFNKAKHYLSYKSEDSSEMNGGNALFAALEYWNKGIVFNSKRNIIAALRIF